MRAISIAGAEEGALQFVRINGAVLHYQVISATPGKPRIVFSNSLGTDFRIWRDVVVRLAGDFSLLCYDKRGHGLSDVGKAPYTIADHAADLAGLIEHAGFGPAIVCGLSVGGMIAQQLYLSRPDLVQALALCDTAHRITTTEGWNDRIARIERDGIESVADAIMKRWFSPSFRELEPDAVSIYRNMLVRSSVAGYNGTIAAIRDADFTATAPLIRAPTVCMVGENDGSTPPDLVQGFARIIPGARYELIPNAGHLPCVEQPDTVVEIIRGLAALLGAADDQRRH